MLSHEKFQRASLSLFTLCMIMGCEVTPPSQESYFGTSRAEALQTAPICLDHGFPSDNLVNQLDGMGGPSISDMQSPELTCEPKLFPSGEDHSGVPTDCLEGCEELATCAIDGGECPELRSCDREGVVDMCMSICSDQLLAVFSSLTSCADIIGLARQGLDMSFNLACGEE